MGDLDRVEGYHTKLDGSPMIAIISSWVVPPRHDALLPPLPAIVSCPCLPTFQALVVVQFQRPGVSPINNASVWQTRKCSLGNWKDS